MDRQQVIFRTVDAIGPRAKALFILVLFLSLAYWRVNKVGAQDSQVLLVEIEGPVTPTMASFFDRAIEEVSRSGAEALVIVLDTPGGSVDVTLDIIQSFRNATTPIIVYVGPAGAQAASAGSMITAAAHAAGMAPETVIGAATPVDGSGADIGDTLLQKLTEDLKATMRNLTERRGKAAVKLAEEMIEDARAVTSKEALEVGLIDAIADDVPHLLRQLDGITVELVDGPVTLRTAGASQRSLRMNIAERLLYSLSNPVLIGLLMTIGVQAIFIEISSPGGWVAGFIGVLCLGLGLYGLGTLPANWLGLGLILVAFVLFILEVKTPAVGVLAVAGALTLLAGLLVLFNSQGTPQFARISIGGAAGITLFSASFFIFVITKALQAQRGRPVTGKEGLIGQVGPVKIDFATRTAGDSIYTGTILVMGEIWRATSKEAISKDEQIVVEDVDGFTLRVKRFTDS
jgi:membrane-bound serine protease (ClpP class)